MPEGKDNNPFSAFGAYVGMKTAHLGMSSFGNQILQQEPRSFQQLYARLFYQFRTGSSFGQMFLGGSKHAALC